jgi:hypothetical protein
MYDRHKIPAALLDGSAGRKTAGGRRPLTREDLLQVAISLVKSEPAASEPADFMGDVALTFETLSGEVWQIAGSRSGRLIRSSPVAAGRR